MTKHSKIMISCWAFIIAIVVGRSAAPSAAESNAALQGVWRTLEVVVPGAPARTFRPEATLAIFHGRHYSRVEVHAEQPLPQLTDPSSASADQLRAVWQQLDASDRRDVFVAARAANCAAALGAPEDGRGWLRPFWEAITEQGADERQALAEALVLCTPGLGPEWLQRLEGAVQRFPRDGTMALALGHALAERQLWGKARLMLEQAAEDRELSVAARRRSWLRLAEMADQDDDGERRARCFEAAARLG